MTDAEARPNIVVVVLDCVRASDFVGGSPGLSGAPFYEELRRECVEFPRAISPAPWTIPSHASLFSGLPPWETGCHWKGDLHLSKDLHRLPGLLAADGYRTMSLSANPVIEPSFGLVDGFQQAAWSGWWEPFLRFSTRDAPHLEPRPAHRRPNRLAAVRKGPVEVLIKKIRPTLIQNAFIMAAGNRLVHGIRQERGAGARDIAQWLEPTFDGWVRRTPPDQPIFAFVNLLDAHEPYFPDERAHEGAAAWWAYAATRQDPVAWMNGDWKARPAHFELMHRLYRDMIVSMDRRLRSIVDTLKATGRWDRTALIVTGDHGQAFGEHGTLFHFFRVDEQLIRVPLWVRLPGAAQRGTVARGWASLIDVAPTAFELAGRPRSLCRQAYPLSALVDAARPEPVTAISDGIVWGHFRNRFRPEGLEKFDRVYAAAYEDDIKVVADIKSGTAVAYDVGSDRNESRNLWSDTDSQAALATSARAAGERVLSATHTEVSGDVEDRLKAWGYI